MKAKATTVDGGSVDVDVGFIIVCFEHGTAFGPYPGVQEAAEMASTMLDLGSECKFDVFPLLKLNIPEKPAAVEPELADLSIRGYL